MRLETSGPVVESRMCDSGYWVHVASLGRFPLDGGAKAELLRLVSSLTRAAAASGRGDPTLWLDTQQLHRDGGSKIFSSHARSWSPDMGFCFDPGEPPPRKLELSDLMDVEYGSPLKISDRSAMWISKPDQTIPAYEVLAGRGLAVLLYFTGPTRREWVQAAKQYQRHTREELRSYMVPGEFQNFDFYLPLLTLARVEQARGEEIARWMGEATLYMRECEDAKELLLVSKTEMGGVFEAAGLVAEVRGEHAAVWRTTNAGSPV